MLTEEKSIDDDKETDKEASPPPGTSDIHRERPLREVLKNKSPLDRVPVGFRPLLSQGVTVSWWRHLWGDGSPIGSQLG